jgi:hypothetical protein
MKYIFEGVSEECPHYGRSYLENYIGKEITQKEFERLRKKGNFYTGFIFNKELYCTAKIKMMEGKMKIKVKQPLVEFEIPDGYYMEDGNFYLIKGDNVIKVRTINDYASIGTGITEYDQLNKAVIISQDEFEAELEKAFEIIGGKL